MNCTNRTRASCARLLVPRFLVAGFALRNCVNRTAAFLPPFFFCFFRGRDIREVFPRPAVATPALPISYRFAERNNGANKLAGGANQFQSGPSFAPLDAPVLPRPRTRNRSAQRRGGAELRHGLLPTADGRQPTVFALSMNDPRDSAGARRWLEDASLSFPTSA